MNRRQFITVGAAATIATPHLRLPATAAGPRSEWRRDGAGSVARLGVLTPDFDSVPESEMSALAPPGVSIHGARVRRQPGGARAFAEPPSVDDAVESLAALAPPAILFAYTSSSYAMGAASDDTVRARLENRSGKIPVLLTCPAASQALRVLGALRVALVHPPWRSEEVNAQGHWGVSSAPQRLYDQPDGEVFASPGKVAPQRAPMENSFRSQNRESRIQARSSHFADGRRAARPGAARLALARDLRGGRGGSADSWLIVRDGGSAAAIASVALAATMPAIV